MKLFNKNNKLFKIMGILVLVQIIFFLIANVMMYKNALDFAKKYGATDIKIGYIKNPDYEPNVEISDISSEAYQSDYSSSLFTFYKDGVDLVKANNLYEEYNRLSNRNYNYMFNVLMINAIVCALSCLGIYISATKRYFVHGFISGILITYILSYLYLGAYLHPIFSPMVVILLLISMYLLAKTRFCDYNESRLTGIFK